MNGIRNNARDGEKCKRMKIDKITPQIAALYLGRMSEMKLERHPVYTGPISIGWIGLLERDKVQITPRLRRLESITEEEAREVYDIKYGEPWEDYESEDESSYPVTCLGSFWTSDIEIDIEEGKEAIGIPSVWLYLLSKGFDLFGLIDAGLAKEIKHPSK